jgi:hypothetical protein
MAGDTKSNDGPLSAQDQIEPAEKQLAPLLIGATWNTVKVLHPKQTRPSQKTIASKRQC